MESVSGMVAIHLQLDCCSSPCTFSKSLVDVGVSRRYVAYFLPQRALYNY
jgi:hypothetical protein